MKIKWTIEKPRGNFRPVLEYEMILEDFEKELAMPSVSVSSDVPVIPDPRCHFCMPNSNEREPDWRPTRFHNFTSPDFRRGKANKRLILPYTCSSDFVEVESSFKRLRDAFEKEMQGAKDSESLLIRKELCLTEEARQNMATGIAAHRILQLVGA